MYRLTLTLTDQERAELVHIRDHDRRAYLREIAAALLKIADGMAPYAVALHGLLKPRKPDTVYRWLRVYQAERTVTALIYQPRGHRGFSPSARRRPARPTPRDPAPIATDL